MSATIKSNAFSLSRIALAVAMSAGAAVAVAAEPPADVEQIVIEGQRHSAGGHLKTMSEADIRKLSASTSDTASLLANLAVEQDPDRAALSAATAGLYLHSLAGDLAADRSGMDGLVAGDVISSLGLAWKSLRNESLAESCQRET